MVSQCFQVFLDVLFLDIFHTINQLTSHPLVTARIIVGWIYEQLHMVCNSRLCQPVVDYFRARGGDVKLNSRLKNIRLNPDETVAGYELTNGEVVTGDIYVSAMPGAHFPSDMTQGEGGLT
jgi:hypothetical protein